MTYITEINENNKLLIVRTTGDLRTKELSEMGVLMRLQAHDFNYKLIFDYRLSKNYISITEAYYWFSDYYDSVDLKLRQIRAAIISNENDMDFFSFLETTCTNNNIPIKIFLDEEMALKWLIKNPSIN
ncbi:MAG: hypothetical protein WCG93_13760 [Paludibacter sp.]